MISKAKLKEYQFFNDLNSFLKGTLQYLEARVFNLYYNTLYKRSYRSSIQCKNLLKDFGGSNLPGVNLNTKKKGDLNIFLVYRISNWEEVLPVSLKPFGNVHEFEWGSLGFDENDPGWLDKKEDMNQLMLKKYKEISTSKKIDIVIGYISGYTVNPDLLEYFSSQGSLIVNFCLDDKLKFPGKKHNGIYSSPAALASKVDLNLTSSKESLIKYYAHGGEAMFWPEAAHPKIHKPYKTSFKYDVSFVGARYGWRPKFIEKLKRKGVDIVCFGNNWPNGPLSNIDMIKLYSESRINLGFSGIGHSKRLMCLKGRDFEVTMSGGLYLCQNNPELNEVYEIGKEILTYESLEDCYEKISYLLENPDEADRIRTAGYLRAKRDHTYDTRWSEVFQKLGIIEENL